MQNRNVIVAAWAACAVMALGAAVVRADESVPSGPNPPAPTAQEPAPKPLMGLLNSTGIGRALSDHGIQIYGYLEGSYTYSFSAPPGDAISGRLFDFEHDLARFNQANLSIEKTVDAAAAAKDGKWDVGGKVEMLYGMDARFTHANGLLDRETPEVQFDVYQAFADVAVPVGSGLQLRIGKWSTLAGYEIPQPTGNALYSHNFLFNYALPFTHTGVLATYVLNEQWTIDAGVSRGWDQALRDNNGALDYLARATYKPAENTVFYLNLLTGPELAGDNDHWRTVLDLTATHKVGDDLSLVVEGLAGYDGGAAQGGDYGTFFDVTGYATYEVSKYASVTGRVEWFGDEDGTRTGLAGGDGCVNFYSGTLGVKVTPFPDSALGSNFVIRPEVRIDYADQAAFDGDTDNYQVTAAVDAYFTF